MNKGMKTLLIIAALVVLVVGGYKWRYPTYAWHQKLTIEVDTLHGVVTGSSVVGVNVQYQMTFGFRDAASVRNRWEGEAAIVELPGKRYLFALLGHPVSLVQNSYKSVILGSPDARFTDMKAYYSKLTRMRQFVSISSKYYPLLVTFTDINDPKTVKRVDPNDLDAVFGCDNGQFSAAQPKTQSKGEARSTPAQPSTASTGVSANKSCYSLKSITLEITDEPVTKGVVESVLGWLEDPKVMENPGWRALPIESRRIIGGLLSYFPNLKGAKK